MRVRAAQGLEKVAGKGYQSEREAIQEATQSGKLNHFLEIISQMTKASESVYSTTMEG